MSCLNFINFIIYKIYKSFIDHKVLKPNLLSMSFCQEISASLDMFASRLTATDQCAVVCILSHGGDGFLYGSDGKTLNFTTIHRCLSNKNCVQMAGKPKIFIIHTCQGGKLVVHCSNTILLGFVYQTVSYY